MNYGWKFVTLYRRQGARSFPRKGNAKKKNGCVRRPYKELWKEEKWKAKEKRKDTHLNAEFQRRDKKALLSDQCKQIEENNRMRKTRDLFKKIRDTKWTLVLEKTLESPLDCKEIQPVHPKGNQSWMFIGRTDTEAETPILWPPDAKNWLVGKDPGAGKDWRQEDKGMTKDEMVGWHHRLKEHEFE